MKLILPDRSKRITESAVATVEEILLQQGINPIEVMVSRGGKLLPGDTTLGSDDEIRIIRISHGG